MVTRMAGSGEVYIWRDSDVTRSVFVWCFWNESVFFSHRDDIFTFNLVYKEMLYFITFIAILKHTACNELYSYSTQNIGRFYFYRFLKNS